MEISDGSDLAYMRAVSEQLTRIEEKLAAGGELFSFFSAALKAYRQNQLEIERTPHMALARFAGDAELRFPHRKLLEALINLWDFEKATFGEIAYSKLVRKARVGKQAAREYLSLLLQKQYVEKRSDGYRIWYRLAHPGVSKEAWIK